MPHNPDPELSDRLIKVLDDLGFMGVDVSKQISLFEYSGLYSEQHGVALLCDSQAPFRCTVTEIPREDILAELDVVENGFFRYTGESRSEAKKLTNPMSAILSLRQYNGGFHIYSLRWKPFDQWDEDELIEALESLCLEPKYE